MRISRVSLGPLEVGGLGLALVIGGGERHLDRAVGILEDVGDVRLVRTPHLGFARDHLVVAAGELGQPGTPGPELGEHLGPHALVVLRRHAMHRFVQDTVVQSLLHLAHDLLPGRPVDVPENAAVHEPPRPVQAQGRRVLVLEVHEARLGLARQGKDEAVSGTGCRRSFPRTRAQENWR